MDPGAEGKTYDAVAFDITPDRVRAFHELFGGPPGVPPTFFTAAEFAVFPHVIDDPELALDFRKVVHGTQEYEFRRAPAVGETLSVQARIASIRQKGGNGFLVIETTMRDGDDQVVAVARATMIERDVPA